MTSEFLLSEGWHRYYESGFINILGVAVRDGVLVMVAARWDIYARGILGADADAEAISIMVIDEISLKALHSLDRDVFDMVKRAHGRMQGQPSCQGTITALDLGREGSGGEGYLLGTQIRAGIVGAYPLRTVTDADLPRPVWDGAHMAWKMSPGALCGALAARAGARQVLVSEEAATETQRVAIDALRQAGTTDARTAGATTRLLGWMSEIIHRPLVLPLIGVRTHPGFLATPNCAIALILLRFEAKRDLLGPATLSNVSYNLKKLVEMEYMHHQRCEIDRRSVRVRLTDKGRKIRDIVAELFARHAEGWKTRAF